MPTTRLLESFGAALAGAVFGTPTLSSASFVSPETGPIIALAPGRNIGSTRFAIAHQIGHLLDPDTQGASPHCTLAEPDFDYRRGPRESFANAFAVYLLAPKRAVNSQVGYSSVRTPEELFDAAGDVAMAFGLSAGAALRHVLNCAEVRGSDFEDKINRALGNEAWRGKRDTINHEVESAWAEDGALVADALGDVPEWSVEAGKALNPGPDRGTNGQFQAKAPAEEAPKDDAKVVDLKTDKPAEAAKTEAVEEEDDDPEFEIPAEEGKEPVRRKLSQLWEGFERAEKLSKELEEVKTSAQRIPAEYTTQLEETVKTRGDYIKGLEAIARMIQPQRPSLEMLNPNSDKFDPDSYYHLARKFDVDTEHLRRARAGIEEENKPQLADTEVLTKAQSAREIEKLKAAWPEFDKDQKVRKP